MDTISKPKKKPYEHKLERVYWLGVILTKDWNKDNYVIELANKSHTRYILISKPVYHRAYKKEVRYATFSFYKTVTSAYLGNGFILDNDIVPVIKSTLWIRGLQWKYCDLICSLGQPDYEYTGSEFKSAYHFYKRNWK